jgi:hypothetical protein
MNYGKIAYEACRKQSGGKSLISGDELPTWEELPPNIQRAWEDIQQAWEIIQQAWEIQAWEATAEEVKDHYTEEMFDKSQRVN